MKHGSFKALCLIMMIVLAAPLVFGDDSTVDLESKILETWDGDSPYVWKATGSKFATTSEAESFPRVTTVAAFPMAVFGNNREGKELKSLGIQSRFDRRGYNWVDVYPVLKDDGDDAAPAEIPVPGRARVFDLWVWGANINYYIEIYVRDYQGVVHALRLGSINHQGWKNMRVNVPNGIPQNKRILPRLEALKFVKFRIWTLPLEQVGNAYIYFDQFKVLSDMFESIFDGDELADPDYVQELWNGESQDSQSTQN
ncbi:membrane protein [Spirochaetia bacterium]|nr:membrane protein [Spirochaetia bacterium]